LNENGCAASTAGANYYCLEYADVGGGTVIISVSITILWTRQC